MNTKSGGGLLFRQHPSVSKSVVPRAQPVALSEISDFRGSKTRIALPALRCAPGAQALLVEQVSYLGVDVVVEEPIDKLDDLRRRLDLLWG